MSCHPDARGWLCHPEPENCALRRWRGDDTPLTRRFAAPSPRFAGRGTSRYVLLPACGEKVAGGRMRGVSLEAAQTAKDLKRDSTSYFEILRFAQDDFYASLQIYCALCHNGIIPS